MSVREILIKAKEILNQHGWAQNYYRCKDGVFLSEAIQEAGGYKPIGTGFMLEPNSNAFKAHQFIETLVGMKVHKFNDDKNRTKQKLYRNWTKPRQKLDRK